MISFYKFLIVKRVCSSKSTPNFLSFELILFSLRSLIIESLIFTSFYSTVISFKSSIKVNYLLSLNSSKASSSQFYLASILTIFQQLLRTIEYLFLLLTKIPGSSTLQQLLSSFFILKIKSSTLIFSSFLKALILDKRTLD